MDNEEWINDATYKCSDCDCTFRTYILNECGSTNFCPSCGSRNLDGYDED